jgi:hypothetical protein
VSGVIYRDILIKRGKWQKKALRLTRPASSRPNREAQSNEARPKTRPKQSTTRPSPSLERNQRLARALVSSAINASPEPWSRVQSMPRPSPSLDIRLSTHGDRTADATWTMPPPTLWQGMASTILTTPAPVMPYLCHCGYGQTKDEIGDIKSWHYCHNPTVINPPCRTMDEASGGDATTQTELGKTL